MQQIATYEDYCKAIGDSREGGHKRAMLMLHLRSWFDSKYNADKDEITYIDLDSLVAKIPFTFKDLLSKICSDTRLAYSNISRDPREKILRDNIMMPVGRVREIDSKGMLWLSKKPGRNIREKLSGVHSMPGVKRFNSVDTGENRLFLAFSKKLYNLLHIKEQSFPPGSLCEDELKLKENIQRFIRSQEAMTIRPWDNLPPNNCLLSDKNYNKIWKGWLQLQNIDKNIQQDALDLEKNLQTYFFWRLLELLADEISFVQTPVNKEYYGLTLMPIDQMVVGYDKSLGYIQLQLLEEGIAVLYRDQQHLIYIDKLNLKIETSKRLVKTAPIDIASLDQLVEEIAKLLGFNLALAVPEEITPVTAEKAIADIFQVRPELLLENNSSRRLDCRLMRQQLMPQDQEQPLYDIALSTSKAIGLSGKYHCEEYTINNLLTEQAKRVTFKLNKLFKLMKKHLAVEKLKLLLPDKYDLFSQGKLLHSARIYYSEVETLPNSIAAAMYFSTLDTFKQSFKAGDYLVVVDLVDGKYTFSLLRGISNTKLKAQLPETKGIIWERHPIEEYPLKEDTFTQGMSQHLKDPTYIHRNLGYNCLASEAGRLLLHQAPKNYFNITDTVVDIEEACDFNIDEEIEQFLKTKDKYLKKMNRCHVLLLKPGLTCSHASSHRLSKEDCLMGYNRFEILDDATSLPLWRDHLPNLAIKLLYGKFDLVDNITIIPKESREHLIPCDRTFTIPKNQRVCRLQLILNDDLEKLQYEATLSHPLFPLEDSVECRLELRYHYDDEIPYTLVFEPLHKKKAGFASVTANWQEIDKYPVDNLIYPNYQEDGGWEALRADPRKDGQGYEDLIQTVVKYFNSISNNRRFKDGNIWKENKYINYIYYALQKIFNNGRNINTSDCPPELFEAVKIVIDPLHNTLLKTQDKDIRSHSFKLLSLIVVPEEEKAFNLIMDLVKLQINNPQIKVNIPKEVGNALGACTTSQQKALFDTVLKLTKKTSIIDIVNQAAWKNEQFLFNADVQGLYKVFETAVEILLTQSYFNRTDENGIAYEAMMAHRLRCLEFIIAMFRLRQKGDSRLNEALSLNNPLLRKLYFKLETMIEDDEPINSSRLSFDIKKSQEHGHIQDIIYALLCYIKGDSGESEVRIKEISTNSY